MVADVVSIAPIDSLEVLVNGDVVRTVRATDPFRVSFEGRVDMPLGGWVALRASGPTSPYLGDDYAFAQTSPVYVVGKGTRFVKTSDVAFLADTVRAIWTRVEKSRWRSDAERDAFKAAVDRALVVYEDLARSTAEAR